MKLSQFLTTADFCWARHFCGTRINNSYWNVYWHFV